MKIYVPVGASFGTLCEVFREHDIQLVQVAPLNSADTEQLAEIPTVSGDESAGVHQAVFERSEGEFLALERFIRDDGTYGVLKVITPAEFYGEMMRPAAGPCIGADISDHLVNAFDRGLADDFDLEAECVFAYRSSDGRIIHQHST